MLKIKAKATEQILSSPSLTSVELWSNLDSTHQLFLARILFPLEMQIIQPSTRVHRCWLSPYTEMILSPPLTSFTWTSARGFQLFSLKVSLLTSLLTSRTCLLSLLFEITVNSNEASLYWKVFQPWLSRLFPVCWEFWKTIFNVLVFWVFFEGDLTVISSKLTDYLEVLMASETSKHLQSSCADVINVVNQSFPFLKILHQLISSRACISVEHSNTPSILRLSYILTRFQPNYHHLSLPPLMTNHIQHNTISHHQTGEWEWGRRSTESWNCKI